MYLYSAMKRCHSYFFLSLFLLLFTCTSDDAPPANNDTDSEVIDDDTETTEETTSVTYKLLSLGDSYTIGQSVCSSCRFPAQLRDSLGSVLINDEFQLRIVAQTGWTTTNLLNALEDETIQNDYDLVTLLIGVNNQFQGKPFELYETEFPELVSQAIGYASNNASKLIVVSIPDYAYTPFGQGNPNISEGIDQYNAFAQNYCLSNGITFINITDITRLGLEQPELVASDGLHPSTIAYSLFVERLLPPALQKL